MTGSWCDSLARDLADLPAAAAVVIDDAQFAEPSHRTLATLARASAGPGPSGGGQPAQPRVLHVAAPAGGRHHRAACRRARVHPRLRSSSCSSWRPWGGSPSIGGGFSSLTEGWPAGLQMAVLAMRRAGDPREVIDAFATTTTETSDYLANEVMSRLPAGPGRLPDPDLCPGRVRRRAVRGRERPRHDAGRLLDRVVADDLFIYQVDLHGRTVPSPPDVRSLPAGPAEDPSAARSSGKRTLRAAAALRERGDRLAAIRHATAVADMQLAADVLVDSMHSVLEVSHAREANEVGPGVAGQVRRAPPRKPTLSSCSSSCSCWRHAGSGRRRAGSRR